MPVSKAYGSQLRLVAMELKKRGVSLKEQISLNEAIKFNLGKMMKLIEQDKFLKYAFQSNKGSDKAKAEQIFNDHVLGDPKLEKKYNGV